MAAELVRRRVAVIATIGTNPAFAAKAATLTIPIVFLSAEDPVRLGLVASLARPGANLTGINWFLGEVAAKRLDLLRELVPGAARIAVLVDPTNATTNESTLRDVEAAAHSLGLQIQIHQCQHQPRDRCGLCKFCARAARRPVLAVIAAFFVDRRVQLALQALLHKVPAIYPVRDFAEVGGLMSYGASMRDTLSSGRRLYWSHPQWRQTDGPAGRAGEQVRAGHQRRDRQDARPYRAADAARHRRRGDRVTTKRRKFISLVGGAVAAWPLMARAQQLAMPTIGYLSARSPDDTTHLVAAFRRGLIGTGFAEGRNVTIEYSWALGRYDRLPSMAAAFVRRRVSVLATSGGYPAALAAKAATATIPIVSTFSGDPAESGLVASLNRPGGNVTGVTLLTAMLEPKRLGLLRDVFPQATAIGVLLNPNFPPAESQLRGVQSAARTMNLKIHVLLASTDHDIDQAFETVVHQRVQALAVAADPFFDTRREKLVALAARHSVPTMYQFREKAALSSGCKAHPATAPAGSNRSSHGGNELAEAFG